MYFYIAKGRGNVNFRQQQRSLIKLYMRVHLLTLKRRKWDLQKYFFGYFKHTVSNWASTRFVPFFMDTIFFWQCIAKLLATEFVCRLKNDKAQKIETWEQNSKCKRVNIVLLLHFFISLIFLNHKQLDDIWVVEHS